ncbi:MAG: Clp protease ClpP [Oscillospiraceae bacterium]|jgi:ATP-dependent Clp protease protease subunit|nr:Clp protease ClpP [Oscillospiraceae bacterium]
MNRTCFTPPADPVPGNTAEQIFRLYGVIVEDPRREGITPQAVRSALFAAGGHVTIFLNSPGGSCVAASQIYTMLMEYRRIGSVTIKIDGAAISAASVVAMAGTEVIMSPTAIMMIHNPITSVSGGCGDMGNAMERLRETKEGLITAYELKTGLPRAEISRLMDASTWMNARKAVALGFADGILGVRPGTELPGLAAVPLLPD